MNALPSTRLALLSCPFAPSRVALGVLLALGATSAAQAQSLVDLYEAARGYDATFLSARSQVDATLARAEQAKAGLRPQAGLAAAANWSRRDSSAAPLDASFNSQTATLSASQPLYRPANQLASDQGQLSIEISQAQLKAAEQDLIVRTTQAYFDVLAAQDTLTFVQAQKKAVAEQLAAAKRNFEVGTTTVTDSREAQARFDLVVAQEIAAENDLRVKKLALDQLVGKANVAPKPLAAPVALPALVPADPQAWVIQAETGHPTVQQATKGLEIAQLETRKAQAGDKPTLDLVGQYQIARAPSSTSAIPGYVRNNTATVGVQFNMPLYTGGAVQNRVKETPGAGGKSPHRPGSRPTRREPGHAQRLLWRVVGPRPGEGAGSGRSIQPERTRCQQARVPGGRAHQHRRAQCPEPAVPDQARSGRGPLQRADRRPSPAAGERAAQG